MLLNKDNFCYITHHYFQDNDNLKSREFLKNKNYLYLSSYGNEIKSKTIFFYNIEEVIKYFSLNKNINICWHGYKRQENENYNGWKVGEIGVIVTNYLAWQEFAKSNFDYCLLMEDDLILQESFFDQINLYLEYLPSDWDLFSIFRHTEELDNFSKEHILNNLYISKPYAIKSNACYLINKKFINKIFNNTIFNNALDIFLLTNPEINSYSIRPEHKSLCFTAPLYSTIQHTSSLSRDFFKIKCDHLH